MTVSHNNVQHVLQVKPGEAGKVEFQQNIRKIFGLGSEDIIDLTFGCKAPGTGWLTSANVCCARVYPAPRLSYADCVDTTFMQCHS